MLLKTLIIYQIKPFGVLLSYTSLKKTQFVKIFKTGQSRQNWTFIALALSLEDSGLLLILDNPKQAVFFVY